MVSRERNSMQASKQCHHCEIDGNGINDDDKRFYVTDILLLHQIITIIIIVTGVFVCVLYGMES